MSTRRGRILICSALFCAGVLPGAGGPQVRDVDGVSRDLFRPSGAANVLVFVSSDCPISNGYAPELQRICGDYRTKGVDCALVYEDLNIDAAAVRAHREAYRYGQVTAVIDADRAVARRAAATVTPEAVVLDAKGAVRYRGRIDNRYAAPGKPRRVVTAHDLVDALDAVLAGRPVPRPKTEAFGCFIIPAGIRQP